MDSFCGSTFWDEKLTWNTTNPDFTPCFQKTVLVWIPCGILWLFSPIEVRYLFRSKAPRIPWNLLNILKLFLALFLVCVTVAEIIYNMQLHYDRKAVYPADYYSPFIRFISYLLVTVFILLGRKKGIKSSGVIAVFWFVSLVGSLVSYYSIMLRIFNVNITYDESMNDASFITTTIYFSLILGEFFLSCFSDKGVKSSSYVKECPEDDASFLSTVTFWWFNQMAWLGFKKTLTMEDAWALSEDNRTDGIISKFDKYWLPDVQKFKQRNEPKKETRSTSSAKTERRTLSLVGPLLKTFGFQLFLSALFKLIASLMTFVNPLVLDKLIAFIGTDEPLWKGVFYASLMFFASMLESFLNSQYEFKIYLVAMRMRSSIISAIYRKTLVLSPSSKKEFTVGEIVNLMSVDTQRVMDYIQMVNIIWSAPLQIGICIYLLWQQLGVSTLSGLGIMILTIPLNGVVTLQLKTLQFKMMRDKDQRTKLMNEILCGIKVLKLYAWEESFQERIMSFRNKELSYLTKQAYLSAAITFVIASAPFVVALASFATFVLINSENVLDANKAFVSLSLFNILRIPLAFLPMLITFSAMVVVSFRRLSKYLSGEELDPNFISHDKTEEAPIIMKEATFSWTKDDLPVLNDVNLNVKSGSLVAVVGQVGSGKTSLLSALLGELEKINGYVNINGSVAYVPQQAWIQNATLKNNILFTNSFQKIKYGKVIEACALEPDLNVLPGRDETEIGEKGINLSGGQKQRISLARAVYADADIYYLDDPLSAVDAHVGKHIFEKVIGPNGILKHKTRILVTHHISVLPEVDVIVVMKNGMISECGSYRELLQKKGDFAEFLVQFLTQETDYEESFIEVDRNIVEDLVATVGDHPELKRHFSKLSGGESDISEGEGRRRTLSRQSSHLSISEGRWRSSVSFAEDEDSKSIRRRSSAAKTNQKSKLTYVEAAEVGSVKWSVYVDYIKALGLCGTLTIFFGNAAANALNLASSIWLSGWSNDAINPDNAHNIQLRNLRLGVYGGLGAGETIFTLVTSVSLYLACLRASKLLHDQMLVHIFQAPMSFFDTTPMGRILNRFTKDIDTADITIRFNIRMVLIQSFRGLASFLVIAMQTPIFLIAVLPLSLLYYFLQKLYIPTSRQLKRLESITRSPIYVHFSETITGVSSIRAYNVHRVFISESNSRIDTNTSTYFPSIAASRWLAIRLEFLGYCVVFFAALFAVLARNSLDPGTVGLSVSYALTVTGTLNMLVRSIADLETNIVSVERCLEYTKTPVEAPRRIDETKPHDSWPSNGLIQYDNYGTRYREGLDLVLKGICCEFLPEKRVGIVGRTGAGKSSLTLTLFRIIEAAAGRIVIDDVDISKIGLADLRSKLTIIPQDPVLFTGSLRMNLDPFEKYSDEEVWIALEQAHLKQYVSSLEKGLQHEVAEGGENMSVGQRQLICLARALLRKSKILILDEATAAVDLETDDLIQKTIRKEFHDCTVLTIAHRLNTIMDYDRVIVLDNGEIAEMDSPTALLENDKSIFYSMAKDAGLV